MGNLIAKKREQRKTLCCNEIHSRFYRNSLNSFFSEQMLSVLITFYWINFLIRYTIACIWSTEAIIAKSILFLFYWLPFVDYLDLCTATHPVTWKRMPRIYVHTIFMIELKKIHQFRQVKTQELYFRSEIEWLHENTEKIMKIRCSFMRWHEWKIVCMAWAWAWAIPFVKVQ